jgi:hypothetical protein
MRGRSLLTILLLTGGAACNGSPAKPDAGTPLGNPRAKLVSFSASLTESPGATTEQLRLKVQIANVGDNPIEKVGAKLGRAFWSGITLEALYVLDPSTNSPPLVPGETRTFIFLASVAPLGLCKLPLICEANPHSGLMTTSATVISSGGGWAIETDVDVTCAGDFPKACANTVDDACQLKDASGAPLFRCVSKWADVLGDNLCGIADIDWIANCDGGYRRRTVRIGRVSYNYYYAGDSLVVIEAGDAGCVGGPCKASLSPSSCEEALPFYTCTDAGAAPDANGARAPM